MQKKPKILFLVQLPPPVHGASMMNKFLLDSQIVNQTFDKEVMNLDFVSAVSDIGKISIKKIFKTFSFSYKLLKTLYRNKFDLVYFTLSPVGGAFYRDVLFVSVLKLFKTHIVYHLHGKGILKEIENPIKRKIYKYVFKNVSVISLSKKLHFDIIDVFKGTIYDVPNGIPEKNIEPFGRDFTEIVYLSALKKSKGILDLVEALKILDAQKEKFTAKIIGSSTNDLTIEELKKKIKSYGLERKVKVLGPIYGDDKFLELSKSGIFCFPTYYRNECFPLSILEAMMMGLAVVSTNNGAIDDMINHNRHGMIVNKNNPIELSKGLSFLLNNQKTTKEMGVLAQSKFKKLYTIDVFEENMMSVFKQILARND